MFIRKQIIPILLCDAQKFAISTEIFFIPSFFITKKYGREIYDLLNANVKTSKRLGMEKWWWLWKFPRKVERYTIFHFA